MYEAWCTEITGHHALFQLLQFQQRVRPADKLTFQQAVVKLHITGSEILHTGNRSRVCHSAKDKAALDLGVSSQDRHIPARGLKVLEVDALSPF